MINRFKIGIQLYTLREELEKDFEATIRALSEMGYECVEFAGYYGKTAEELKTILDLYGLEPVSVHQNYELFLDSNAQSHIDFLKKLGVKYCAIPWLGVENHAGSPDFSKTVEEITNVGKQLKDNGIQLLYHNHDFEFNTFENKCLIDWLYESIPSEYLQTEFDCCWVKYAGYDPVEFIKKYAKRSEVLHMKDFVCKKLKSGQVYDLIDENGKNMGKTVTEEDNGFDFRPVGTGMLDCPPIIDAAKEIGMKYIIVEQDRCNSCTPLETAKLSIEYLKKLI